MASAPIRTGDQIVTSGAARKALALLRIAVGFVFFWTFLDKTFGLGYSTSAESAWINGGTPAQGFLNYALEEGKPLTGLFQSISSPAADWLFMAGMLGVGLAVILGIGTRVAAVSGSAIMAMMWLAELPFWTVAAENAATNPLVDSHICYILTLIVLALCSAGDTWGLGKWWKSLDIVQKNRWLI